MIVVVVPEAEYSMAIGSLSIYANSQTWMQNTVDRDGQDVTSHLISQIPEVQGGQLKESSLLHGFLTSNSKFAHMPIHHSRNLFRQKLKGDRGKSP